MLVLQSPPCQASSKQKSTFAGAKVKNDTLPMNQSEILAQACTSLSQCSSKIPGSTPRGRRLFKTSSCFPHCVRLSCPLPFHAKPATVTSIKALGQWQRRHVIPKNLTQDHPDRFSTGQTASPLSLRSYKPLSQCMSESRGYSICSCDKNQSFCHGL